MSVAATSQTNFIVAQLFQQFLAGIESELISPERPETEAGVEVVLGTINLDGMCYKLTRQPCPKENAPQLSLSPREQEVVRLVMSGLSTRGIAKVLDISPWTVITHLRRVFSKLNVNSRAEMVACVFREGVLKVDGGKDAGESPN